MLDEISEAILAILREDPTLSTSIKAWFKGVPSRFERYPYLAVIWSGGDLTFNGKVSVYENDFEVIIVDLKPKAEDAEESVMKLSEAAYEALAKNHKLNGTVDGSRVVRWDSEGLPTEKGSLRGARLILRAVKLLV
ncbi:hypothetical protein DRO57_05665 [Candidatus Bathyarchaeota archaeon]|nr:MAG: hypothetical protein DRO57_05665 [Candidatus Bathyarchaeota archaeon]